MRIALLLAIALAVAAPALAAKPKPEIIVKTKAVEISVTLDDAIKHNAGLAANLMAEGQRWIDKQSKEASSELKSSPELFRGGQRWTLERSYTLDSLVIGRYASITRSDYSFTGGAHPNTTADTILWDNQDKKRISIRPFFTDLSDNSPALVDIRKVIIEALIAEKKERGTYDAKDLGWTKNVKPSLLKIGPVTLEPSTDKGKSSGLTFNYPQYAVGPYVEGAYTAFVPWKAFATYLSPEGKAIFAGEKPPEAADKDK